MSKEQKRLAAIFLCLLGILGTITAMKERPSVSGAGTAVPTAVESTAEAGRI